MVGQLFHIARYALIEALRQPVYVVILLLVAGLLLANPTLSKFTLDDDNKLLIDLGLSTTLLGGVILGAFAASGLLRREIEEGSLLTVLSKPISRGLLLAGKFIGVTAAVTLALWIWMLIYLLSLRQGVFQSAVDQADGPVLVFGSAAAVLSFLWAVAANFFRSKNFGAQLALSLGVLLTVAYGAVLVTRPDWTFQPIQSDLDPQVLAALLLATEVTWIFCAVAVCAATRLGQMSTLSLCIILFLIGLGSDSLLGNLAESNALAALLHHVVPNLQFLWLADALTQSHPISANYVLLVSAYAAAFVLAALFLALALFQTKEVR